MIATDENPYPRIKAYERTELDGLTDHLEKLDSAGWVEQSYCTDWLVYQDISHIASGSRIGALRIKQWMGNGPPVTREAMQSVWAHFDSLGPEQMLGSYMEAVEEYLAVEATMPDAAGLQEVDGFAGRRPIHAYQLFRVWELACHVWDAYVGRNRFATLHPEAVSLLGPRLDQLFVGLDKQRAAALTATPTVFELADSRISYTLDPLAERPRLEQGAAPDAKLVIQGPDEEIVRFVAGRHFVPGSRPALKAVTGTPQDLSALRRALR